MNVWIVLLLVLGVLAGVRGGLATFNAEFASRYARTSPTAAIWRWLLGESRAVVLIHRVLGPLLFVVGTIIAMVVLYYALS